MRVEGDSGVTAVVGLLDLLRVELPLPLYGIYRRDLAPNDDMRLGLSLSPRYRELATDGVLLSHAHLDHSGCISFLDTDIPICAKAMHHSGLRRAPPPEGKNVI